MAQAAPYALNAEYGQFTSMGGVEGIWP